MLLLTRRYSFCAAHRLYNPDLSEAENAHQFGPCVRLHGHNYTLEITISGLPDPQTGMIWNLPLLDAVVKAHILIHVDHFNLDEDVPFLKDTISTIETMSEVFYKQLLGHLPQGVHLYRVRLYENENHWAEFSP